MSAQGTVKSFNPTKGWGFITIGDRDVFLHVKECKDGVPQTGDLLTFDLEEDPISNGRTKASNITGCTGTADAKGNGKGKGKAGTGSCQGPVKSFNTQKGWGFITYEGIDIFVHAKDCHGGVPQTGDWVQFDVEDDPVRGAGNKKASNVTGGTGFDSYNGGGCKGDGGWGKGKGGYGPMWDGGYGKGGWGKDSWGAGPYGKGGDMWGCGGGWGKGYGKCKGGW